ncbi:TPA: hypothetical protein IAA87_03165 [Candidatus Avigastranaerophilus faecigallinarum]|nr:hypothetical protein [Candidatus Avigastranaerophilus faecigallinarum]
MIITEEIIINNIERLSSEAVELELKKISLDILRWAIVSSNNNKYKLCISYVVKNSNSLNK